ncbi:MAG: RHS repeat-associated core domain-containing protein [Pirellulales bacterium]|nr:RHS repeat-associated core domain-containing protein [Pirellulales bacterium]
MIDDNDDFKNTYAYDGRGRMTSVVQEGQEYGNSAAFKRVEFAYDEINRLTGIDRYQLNAEETEVFVANSHCQFDFASRLTALTHQVDANNILADYGFEYDAAHRLTEFTSLNDSSGGLGTVTYDYDDFGQLLDVDYANWLDGSTVEDYDYDENGNRETANGATYATGDHNRMTSDGNFTYEYDGEGNRTAKTAADGLSRVVYEWDYRNRLTKVPFLSRASTQIAWENADTDKVVDYAYDVFNRLIHKEAEDFDLATVNQEAYVYDGQHVALKFARGDGDDMAASDLAARYLYGPAVDMVMAEEATSGATSGNVLWMLADNQGTIRDVAIYDDQADEASVVNHLTYGAFGNLTENDLRDPDFDPTFSYTGRQFDADADLYYYRARWYDAQTGRFIGEDPLGFAAGDANLARYCGNGPTIFSDPSGCGARSWAP